MTGFSTPDAIELVQSTRYSPGIVDADPAAVFPGGPARVGDRARAHERAPRTGGLARAELARGVDDDAHTLRFDAELFDRDLRGDGVHALTHLGPAVPDLDRAVGLETHDRAHDLQEAVAEAGVLQAQTETDRASRRGRGLVRGLDRLEATLRAAAPVVHDLAGTPHLARA